jgi:zinc/manganese transport system ATP-binding protein
VSPTIEAVGATVRLGKTTIQEDMRFEVPAGEFVVVLGPNGAGKSTLLKSLLGFIKPVSGQMRVLGRPPRTGNRDIGYVPQFHVLESAMTLRARDIVGFGWDGHRWGIGFPNRARRARIDQVLAEVDGLELAEQPFGQLSGGERQRLVLAQALLSDPKILLLDEPLASLDVSHAQEMIALVNRVCRQRGVTVLLVAHDVNPLLPVADRILYMANRRCAIGTPAEVISTASLSALYGSRVEVIRAEGRLFVVGAEI